MSNFDGMKEQTAIMGKLGTLVGGRVVQEIRAGQTLQMPYLLVTFGTPIPGARGRGLLGEKTQPYIQGFSVTTVAETVATLNAISPVVSDFMLDFKPSETAGAIKGGTGTTFPGLDASGAVVRRSRVQNFEAVINL